MNLREAIDAFRRETTPSPEAVTRLVSEVFATPAETDRLLRELPEVTPEDVKRLVTAVDRRRAEPARRTWRIGLLGAGLVAAVAVAAVVAVSTQVATDPSPDPSPQEQHLAIQLSGVEAAPGKLEVRRGIDLVFEGSGVVAGTAASPEVQWAHGTVGVEVQPGQGLVFAVVTREAKIRVIGTGFEVKRDVLGTAVSVSHGRVEVSCTAGGVSVLEPGGSTTCLPTTGASLLARAHALVDGGADPEKVLATLDLASPLAGPPVDAEVVVLRIQTLIALGERSRALDAAEAWLATARSERRPEVLAMAASLSFSAGGCEWALPYVEELRRLGRVPKELETCSTR